MNERQEKRYYVDFRETGGVVHSRPTRVLPELVFTGRTKSQLDIELEQHAKMVQEILGESAHEGLRLARATEVARPVFLDLSLPLPGLIELKDNFYTGWFYTIEDGKTYAAFRGKDNVSQSPYVRNKRTPYFLLDRSESEFWNQRFKQDPLTVEEMDMLFLSPSIETQPSYQNLAKLDLKNLTGQVVLTGDGFWTTFKTFDRNDRSDAKREFLRDNLLDLELLERVHGRSHRAALREIRGSMEKSEITVFPLGQEGCVVRYISDIREKNKIGGGQTTIRTLPLPHNLMRHFQRYGRLGERPMTKGEFENLYRRLVDSNTKLSF